MAAGMRRSTNAPGGRLPRERYDVILRRASLEEMWHPVVETTSGYGSESDFMGLSFFGTRRNGVTYMGHTGSQAGFRAVARMRHGRVTLTGECLGACDVRHAGGERRHHHRHEQSNDEGDAALV